MNDKKLQGYNSIFPCVLCALCGNERNNYPPRHTRRRKRHDNGQQGIERTKQNGQGVRQIRICPLSSVTLSTTYSVDFAVNVLVGHLRQELIEGHLALRDRHDNQFAIHERDFDRRIFAQSDFAGN